MLPPPDTPRPTPERLEQIFRTHCQVNLGPPLAPGELDTVLNAVQAKLTTGVLTQLVAAISLQHHTPQQVAAGFLAAVRL